MNNRFRLVTQPVDAGTRSYTRDNGQEIHFHATDTPSHWYVVPPGAAPLGELDLLAGGLYAVGGTRFVTLGAVLDALLAGK